MPTVVYVVIWGCAVVALFVAMITQWLALRQAPRNRIDSTGGWLTIFFDREAFRGKATRYRAWAMSALGLFVALWLIMFTLVEVLGL